MTEYKIVDKDGEKHLVEVGLIFDTDLGKLDSPFFSGPGEFETRNILSEDYKIKDKHPILDPGREYEMEKSGGEKGTLKKQFFGGNYNYEPLESDEVKTEDGLRGDRSYTTRDSNLGDTSIPGAKGCFITLLAVLGLGLIGGYLGNGQRTEKQFLPKVSRELSLEEKTKHEISVNLDGWVRRNYSPSPYMGYLSDIVDYQILGNDFWVIGYVPDTIAPRRPYLFHSPDNQKNWSIKFKGGAFSDIPFKVEFVNDNEGYIATSNSIVYTQDKGNNWETLFSQSGIWNPWDEKLTKLNSSVFNPITGFKIESIESKRILQITLSGGDVYFSLDGRIWVQNKPLLSFDSSRH